MSLTIDHYSDLLCVWAYVTQSRVDRLLEAFGAKITVHERCVSVYGAAADKVTEHWGGRGGHEGYGRFVVDLVRKSGDLPVHTAVWVDDPPASSAPGHLWLCASRIAEADGDMEAGTAARFTWALRSAFFAEARNIARFGVIAEVAESVDLPLAPVEKRLADGRAHAAFCADLVATRDRNIRISPTLTLNEERQRLTGNVSYEVLEANVRALL